MEGFQITCSSQISLAPLLSAIPCPPPGTSTFTGSLIKKRKADNAASDMMQFKRRTPALALCNQTKSKALQRASSKGCFSGDNWLASPHLIEGCCRKTVGRGTREACKIVWLPDVCYSKGFFLTLSFHIPIESHYARITSRVGLSSCGETLFFCRNPDLQPRSMES